MTAKIPGYKAHTRLRWVHCWERVVVGKATGGEVCLPFLTFPLGNSCVLNTSAQEQNIISLYCRKCCLKLNNVGTSPLKTSVPPILLLCSASILFVFPCAHHHRQPDTAGPAGGLKFPSLYSRTATLESTESCFSTR